MNRSRRAYVSHPVMFASDRSIIHLLIGDLQSCSDDMLSGRVGVGVDVGVGLIHLVRALIVEDVQHGTVDESASASASSTSAATSSTCADVDVESSPVKSSHEPVPVTVPVPVPVAVWVPAPRLINVETNPGPTSTSTSTPVSVQSSRTTLASTTLSSAIQSLVRDHDPAIKRLVEGHIDNDFTLLPLDRDDATARAAATATCHCVATNHLCLWSPSLFNKICKQLHCYAFEPTRSILESMHTLMHTQLHTSVLPALDSASAPESTYALTPAPAPALADECMDSILLRSIHDFDLSSFKSTPTSALSSATSTSTLTSTSTSTSSSSDSTMCRTVIFPMHSTSRSMFAIDSGDWPSHVDRLNASGIIQCLPMLRRICLMAGIYLHRRSEGMIWHMDSADSSRKIHPMPTPDHPTTMTLDFALAWSDSRSNPCHPSTQGSDSLKLSGGLVFVFDITLDDLESHESNVNANATATAASNSTSATTAESEPDTKHELQLQLTASCFAS